MPWPSLQDYNEAIQFPQSAFDDPELKFGSPELSPLGLPRAITGQFASVYRLSCGTRNWAVRCFSHEVKDHQQRYELISQYLATANIPHLVGFNYLPKGIKIRGQWYPILKMEWVNGNPLLTYIKHNLNNISVLQQLATQWVIMIRAMQAKGIAHGDLQHGNILITQNGEIKLVDYDGMFVPPLAGKKSLELGHRNYQHPARTEDDFGPYLDSFSAWVIYISLVGLCVDGKLRALFNADNEFLLLRKDDFNERSASPVLARLEQHSDSSIQALATLFRSMLYSGPQQVPSLDGHIPTLPSASQASPLASWILDHRNAPASHQPLVPTNKHAAPLVQDASWVLDFISGPVSPKRTFLRLRGPRIATIISVVTLLMAIVLSIVLSGRPELLQTHGLDNPLLLLAANIGLAAFIASGNLLLLDWHYSHESSVIEKRKLKAQEKQITASLTKIQVEIEEYVEKAEALRVAESGQRKEIDDKTALLRRQEQKEHQDLNSALQKQLANVNSKRISVEQEEGRELSRLQANLGSRVRSLRRQIASLPQDESDEIDKEVRSIRSKYVDDFLKQHSVRDVHLPGAKYTPHDELVGRLRARGIATAYDVSYARVDAVYGFGPARTEALVNWRRNLEIQAQRQAPTKVAVDVEKAIRQKYAERRRILEGDLNNLQKQLATGEESVRSQYLFKKKMLDDEQASAETKAQKAQNEITARYAQLHAAISKDFAQSTEDFRKQRHALEENTAIARKKMQELSWKLAKVRHELAAFRHVSFATYCRVVLFGQSIIAS